MLLVIVVVEIIFVRNYILQLKDIGHIFLSFRFIPLEKKIGEKRGKRGGTFFFLRR